MLISHSKANIIMEIVVELPTSFVGYCIHNNRLYFHPFSIVDKNAHCILMIYTWLEYMIYFSFTEKKHCDKGQSWS